jgi:hypothetical protein
MVDALKDLSKNANEVENRKQEQIKIIQEQELSMKNLIAKQFPYNIVYFNELSNYVKKFLTVASFVYSISIRGYLTKMGFEYKATSIDSESMDILTENYGARLDDLLPIFKTTSAQYMKDKILEHIPWQNKISDKEEGFALSMIKQGVYRFDIPVIIRIYSKDHKAAVLIRTKGNIKCQFKMGSIQQEIENQKSKKEIQTVEKKRISEEQQEQKWAKINPLLVQVLKSRSAYLRSASSATDDDVVKAAEDSFVKSLNKVNKKGIVFLKDLKSDLLNQLKLLAQYKELTLFDYIEELGFVLECEPSNIDIASLQKLIKFTCADDILCWLNITKKVYKDMIKYGTNLQYSESWVVPFNEREEAVIHKMIENNILICNYPFIVRVYYKNNKTAIFIQHEDRIKCLFEFSDSINEKINKNIEIGKKHRVKQQHINNSLKGENEEAASAGIIQ